MKSTQPKQILSISFFSFKTSAIQDPTAACDLLSFIKNQVRSLKTTNFFLLKLPLNKESSSETMHSPK